MLTLFQMVVCLIPTAAIILAYFLGVEVGKYKSRNKS